MTDDPRGRAAHELAAALRSMQRAATAPKHESWALARRAVLRQADRGRFGISPRADAELLKIVTFERDGELPWLDPRTEHLLDDAMLVAHLVAVTGIGVRAPGESHASFGRDARRAVRPNSGAIERAMIRILGADREDLAGLLRSALSLVHDAGQSVAADALVRDLGYWADDSQRVHRRWSYDFWAQRDAEQQGTAVNEETRS